MCVCVCFHARTQALQDRVNKECFHSVIKLTSMQTIPHVWTDSMGIPRGRKVHVNRLRLSSRAGPPQRRSGTTPGASPGQQTCTSWNNSGKVEAWKNSVFLREERKTLPFFYHLLSIRDWTLCTSSRAIFKICWTS